MEIIASGYENILKLCGKQKHKPSEKYRTSRFCVKLPCEDGTLYYQTMTGTLILLKNDEIPDSCYKELIENWFLVPEKFDETRHLAQLRTVARMLDKKKNTTGFTILTTTDCNARCFYCYELGVKRLSMSEKTAHDIVDYIAEKSAGNALKLRWFGGEPLFNRPVIEIISAGLRERDIPFKSKMVSNGFYLDAQTAKQAKEEWHLENVQITLDGTREIYNRVKAYIDKEADPYTRVLNNIESAMKSGIRVTIRLNINRKNADNMLELAEELGKRFGGNTMLNVYVAVLHDYSGPVQGFHSVASEDESALRIVKKLKTNGLDKIGKLTQKPRLNSCMADDDGCEVIMPDGRILKCEHIEVAETIGSIYNEDRDMALIRAWKETADLPKCSTCALQPLCFNLRKCPWVKDDCHSARQAIMLYNCEEQIRKTYMEYKEAEQEKRK